MFPGQLVKHLSLDFDTFGFIDLPVDVIKDYSNWQKIQSKKN